MKGGAPPTAIAALVCLCCAAQSARGASACLPDNPLPVTVRIGEAPPATALLEGGSQMPLSLKDVDSGRLLWSAGAGPFTTQRFGQMDAGFRGSLAAIDLDADGLHDRIYAGDLLGRLWRFDLHHGAAATAWASGGVFADFSNHEGRGFLAAPDISLSGTVGVAPWLNIAVGTAAPGNASASNRFYVLRDHAVHEAWSDADYRDWRPIREPDLLRLAPTSSPGTDAPTALEPGSAGWYVELGSGHVVAPAITVAGHTVLVIAAALPRDDASCEILARIARLELDQARILPDALTGEWRSALPLPIGLAAGFLLEAAGDSIALCTLDGLHIPDCDVDTRPRKSWWRRNDAE